MRGFTDALRQELRGTGVSAVTVHPGGITANITADGARMSEHVATGAQAPPEVVGFTSGRSV